MKRAGFWIRLTGLEQIIRFEDIQQALDAAGRVNSRKCTLTHEVIPWVEEFWAGSP